MFGRKSKDKPTGPAGDNGVSAVRKQGFFTRLRQKLNRGDSWLTYDLAELLPAGKINDAAIEELEMRLLTADVGVAATEKIIAGLNQRVARNELQDINALLGALDESLRVILDPVSIPLDIPADIRPFVILVVGVNGSGKTTTIGKIANRLREQDLSIMLAAGDTYRAAAIEQLQVWGERNNVPVISQHTGADPAAVAYDSYEAARARGIDVLIVDTAGRLHSQTDLMEELKKINRVLGKIDASAPHEIMLVLDGSMGQNALAQARQFDEAVGLTGITVTKLDGTAKGGVVLALADTLAIPLRYIGVGEQADDLGVFDSGAFVSALLRPATDHIGGNDT